MSSSETEEIQGFDPKHDDARTPNGGRVKKMYHKLKDRGEDEAAEEIRHESDLREQLRLAETHPEFDPKHDNWKTTSRGQIAYVYDWLRENGHVDEAEELRQMDTVRQQQNRVGELKDKHSITPPGE